MFDQNNIQTEEECVDGKDPFFKNTPTQCFYDDGLLLNGFSRFFQDLPVEMPILISFNLFEGIFCVCI